MSFVDRDDALVLDSIEEVKLLIVLTEFTAAGGKESDVYSPEAGITEEISSLLWSFSTSITMLSSSQPLILFNQCNGTIRRYYLDTKKLPQQAIVWCCFLIYCTASWYSKNSAGLNTMVLLLDRLHCANSKRLQYYGAAS